MNVNDAPTTIFLAALQVIAFVAFAPFLTATIRRTKARLQSRRGPGLLQPYRDLAKWWGKMPLESNASGPVARYAPAFVLGAIVTAVLLVPWATARTPLPGWGDLLVLVGLFALARFALALAALDSGSAFGGMGSSRDVAISALAEPALVMGLAGVAIAAGSSDLGTISAFGIGHGVGLLKPAHMLEMAAFALVIVAETGHHPVDNPDTHLELTMIHEGMLIEASGRSLATLVFASELKLAVLAALFSAAFLPFGAATEIAPLPIAFGLIVGLGKMLVIGQVLALLDGSLAKMRIMGLPDLLGLASLLALSGLGIQVLLP
jgi:formate hydrogenlyase subunit 4